MLALLKYSMPLKTNYFHKQFSIYANTVSHHIPLDCHLLHRVNWSRALPNTLVCIIVEVAFYSLKDPSLHKICENTVQQKPVFSHILCSALL